MNKLILAADGSGDAQTIGEIKTLFKGDTEVFIKPGEYYKLSGRYVQHRAFSLLLDSN